MWEDNSCDGNAHPDDKALIVALNPERGEAAYLINGAPRSAKCEELQVSPLWKNQPVEVYVAFISNDEKRVATSTYLGTVTVV